VHILDGVKDHVIPHIVEKDIAREDVGGLDHIVRGNFRSAEDVA